MKNLFEISMYLFFITVLPIKVQNEPFIYIYNIKYYSLNNLYIKNVLSILF